MANGRRRVRGLVLAAMLGLTACGTGSASAGPVVLRLGFFANLTHATALVGIERGIFADRLGEGVRLEPTAFAAGGEVIQALFAGAIDVAYIGPNPAINGFANSDGDALRIISGATSGGAFLVVRPGITAAADLAGATLATPQLGNTQDIALRAWLRQAGLTADESGGGDVSIVPQENATSLDAFRAGEIDGAWVPEPWATRLIQEGGATVLVDERDLWPDARYVTTQLVVATSFLQEHPDVVKRLLEGQVAANEAVNREPAAAQRAANDLIEQISGKRIADEVLTVAWPNLTFTNDPIGSSLTSSAAAAVELGLLDPVDLTGIYHLDILNKVLAAAGEPRVSEDS